MLVWRSLKGAHIIPRAIDLSKLALTWFLSMAVGPPHCWNDCLSSKLKSHLFIKMLWQFCLLLTQTLNWVIIFYLPKILLQHQMDKPLQIFCLNAMQHLCMPFKKMPHIWYRLEGNCFHQTFISYLAPTKHSLLHSIKKEVSSQKNLELK